MTLDEAKQQLSDASKELEAASARVIVTERALRDAEAAHAQARDAVDAALARVAELRALVCASVLSEP